MKYNDAGIKETIRQNSISEIKGYCSQCSCYCPTISLVRVRRFVEVKPDEEHPNSCPLCPKGSVATPTFCLIRGGILYGKRTKNY